jgi:choline dehydrogenase-like flavoprotein
VEHEPRIQQLSDDLEKQDLHPFHLPIGVRLTQDAHGRATRDSVCIRCDRVDGFPCLVGGKTDAQVICVDPALAHEKFALRTGAHVTRLETDPGGRTATAVVAELNDPDGAAERPAPRRSGERLGRGGLALHAAQQPGDDRGLEGPEPDEETAGVHLPGPGDQNVLPTG